MYSAATVLASDNTTTTNRRRHWGATWPSARRRSLSNSGTLPLGTLRGHDDDVRHVGAQIDLSEVLEVARRVAIDRRAGRRDVQLAAVGADDESHARTSGEFRFPDDASRIEIERPELVVADLVVDSVGALAIG